MEPGTEPGTRPGTGPGGAGSDPAATERRELLDLVAPVAAARWGDDLAPSRLELRSVIDVNRGRGVFSRVLQVSLAAGGSADEAAHDSGGTDRSRTLSVVVKLPVDGPNGVSARRSGAYRREALAYRTVLPDSPIRSPRAHRVVDLPGGGVVLVLEDLTGRRMVDQLDGLAADDALAVAEALARFHRHWSASDDLDALPVRRSVPASLPVDGLRAGLDALDTRWSEVVTAEQRTAFGRLVERRDDAAHAFSRAGPLTLCHGDPRADNLVFDDDGTPVLFDWQQLAVQFGAADLAWLAATSLRPAVRRRIEPDLVARYGATMDAYRLGLVLPGLAVLFLAQRRLDDDRARRFVATSLSRIGTALVDLEPAG